MHEKQNVVQVLMFYHSLDINTRLVNSKGLSQNAINVSLKNTICCYQKRYLRESNCVFFCHQKTNIYLKLCGIESFQHNLKTLMNPHSNFQTT
jgi:hypothetical protein